MYYGLAPSSLWYASTKPPFAPVVPNKSYRLLGGIPCSFGPTPVRKLLAGWDVRRCLDFLPFFVGLIFSSIFRSFTPAPHVLVSGRSAVCGVYLRVRGRMCVDIASTPFPLLLLQNSIYSTCHLDPPRLLFFLLALFFVTHFHHSFLTLFSSLFLFNPV